MAVRRVAGRGPAGDDHVRGTVAAGALKRRCACFLAGDSYPRDAHVEQALRACLGPLFREWVGQAESLARTGEASFSADIGRRVAALNRLLPTAKEGRRTVLIGRSSGGRVASLFATRRAVAAVICLAYPFRMPMRVLEPARFAHLAAIGVPTLIVQGVDDPFGGLELTEIYPLSAAVRLHFVSGGHGFEHGPAAWDAIGAAIVGFCEHALTDKAAEQSGFDEGYYLAANPDVAAAVTRGVFRSGAEHFARHGRQEHRSFRLLAPPDAHVAPADAQLAAE